MSTEEVGRAVRGWLPSVLTCITGISVFVILQETVKYDNAAIKELQQSNKAMERGFYDLREEMRVGVVEFKSELKNIHEKLEQKTDKQ